MMVAVGIYMHELRICLTYQVANEQYFPLREDSYYLRNHFLQKQKWKQSVGQL